MDITHEHFAYGGEVDCGAWHKDGATGLEYRLSIRRGDRKIAQVTGHHYQVYRFYHGTKVEYVELTSTLRECVRHVNRVYDQDDTIEGERP